MKFLLILMLFPVWGAIRAQNGNIKTSSIKGLLEIEGQRLRLSNAAITLLYAKDSGIATSTFSDDRGSFVLDGISKGEYKLYIRYLGCKAVWRTIRITEKDTIIDVGTILMKEQGITLGTVEIVNERQPMVVKKDTLEFNASAFKTREYAVVEELLKRLPGVEIAKDGTIKVNGVVVEKLMVDGKPFLVDDPIIVTGNLTADMIEKIQFIDRRSDWSQFTGINDGKREKTINFTIKKERRSTYFGRASGTFATGDRFAVNSTISKLKDHQQILFLIGGTDINGYKDKGGQGSVSAGGHSDIRNWSGTGLYNKDFDKKLKFKGAYSAADNYTEDKRTSERQNLLPDTTWYYNSRSNSQVTNRSHNLSVDMELKPDTSQILKVATKFSYGAGSKFQENLYTSLGGAQQLLNSGALRNEGTNAASNFSATALYVKRLRKAGRTVSISTSIVGSANEQKSINKSDNLFVGAAGNTFADTIDQKVNSKETARSISLLVAYTEPLMRDYYLEFVYGYTNDYGTADRFAYDFNPSRKIYDRRNDSLSNSFLNKANKQQVGINIHAQKAKYEYSLGLNAQFVSLDNNNISQLVRIQQHAVGLFPSVGFNYSFNSGKQLQFSFLGDTRQPNTLQLQPVPENSNPLYVQLGNPDLKPEFNTSFGIKYSATNPTTLQMFSIGINYDLFINKIVNAGWFDSLGRQISQPLNIDGSYMINTTITTNFPISKRQASINTKISLGYIRDVIYIDKVKGESRTFSISPSLNYHYSHKELFDIGVEFDANYNMMEYTMQQKHTNFLYYTFSLDNSIRLPLDIVVGGSFICKVNTGMAGADDGNVAMLNAFVSKALFKRRQGLVRLQGADLLNSNVGFIRDVQASYIENIQTTVAQRLFMISFTYFLKNKKK